MDDTKALLQQLTDDLIGQLGVEASAAINEDEDSLTIVLDTPDSGIIIGAHGRTLEALQLLLAQMLYHKTNVWSRVVVTVGDYRERQAEKLKELAENAAAEVAQTGHAVSIPDLSPYERRIVHMVLAENTQVTSESEGEGRHRTLIIKPKM